MALTRITKGVIKPNENYDTHNINSTGIVTAVGANFTGNVSIGGTLTYEDVTSIDSIGIITARDGIKIGTGITIGPAGVGTFTSVHAIDSFACQKYPTTRISFPTNQDHLQIFTSNTQRMRFYGAGIIFIGEESQGPSGNAALYLNQSSTSVYSDSSRLYDQPNRAMVHIKNANATGGGEAGVVFHNDNGGAGVVAIYGKKTSNYTSDCIFRFRDSGSTSVESFRVRTTDIKVGTGVTIETNGQANFAGITTVSGTDFVVKPPSVSSSRIKLGYNEQMKISVSSANQNVIQSTASYLQIASNNLLFARGDTNLNMASFKAGQQCKLTYNYVDRIATSGVGATVYGQFDTTNLNIAGISTFSGNIGISTNMQTNETSGAAVQRFWDTGTITAGSTYKLGKWAEGEGATQLLINVRSEVGGHSGTATYLWQGGYNSLGGYGKSRLFPLSSGNGHGDGPDNGLGTGGWIVLIRQGSYSYEVWVSIPSGKANKRLKVTVTELNRGNVFTDISETEANSAYNASWINSLKTTAIEKLYFKDNNYAYFGNSQDLQIYHTGSGSRIENLTGTFSISNAANEIQVNKSNTEYMARFITDGAVELYHNNSLNFKTTTDGIQVASTSADLQIRSGASSATGSGQITFENVDGNGQPRDVVRIIGASHGNGGYGELKLQTAFNNTLYDRLTISENGDMGLGGSPITSGYTSFTIHEPGTSNGDHVRFNMTNGNTGNTASNGFSITVNASTKNTHFLQRETADMVFQTAGSERVRIDSSGKLAVGTNTPFTYAIATFESTNGIVLQGSSQSRLLFRHTGGGTDLKLMDIQSSNGVMKFRTLDDNTTATDRMVINSNGNIGIGTAFSNPSKNLHVLVDGVGQGIQISNKESLYPAASTGYSDLTFTFRDYLVGGHILGGEAIVRGYSEHAYATQRRTALIFMTSSAATSGNATGSATEKLRITSYGSLEQKAYGGNNKLITQRTDAASSNNDIFFQLLAKNIGGIEVGSLSFQRESAADDAYLAFKTRNTGGSLQERLRIHSDGWCTLNTDTLGNNKNAKELVVSYNNTNVSSGDHGRAGITIRSGSNSSGTSQPGYLLFSDGTSGDNESIGGIKYDHFLDDMVFTANGNERLRIHSDGSITQNYANPNASAVFRISKNGSGAAELRFDTATVNTANLYLGTDEELIVRYGGAEKVRFLQHQGVKMKSNAGSGVGYQTRTQIYPYWTSDTGACRFNITMVPTNTIATPRFWIFTNAVTNQTGTVTIGMNGRTNSPSNARWRYHQSMWQVGMYGEGDNEGNNMRWNDSFGTQKGNATISSGGQYYVHYGHSERDTNANQYQNNYGGWYWHVDTGAAIQAHSFNFDCFFTFGGDLSNYTWYAYVDD